MSFNRPTENDLFIINPSEAKIPNNSLHGLFLVDLDEAVYRTRTIVEASDDTKKNMVWLRVTFNSIEVGGVNNGVAFSTVSNTNHSRSGFVWLGISVASDGNVQLSVNGELVSATSNGISCPTFTKIRIGTSVTGKYEANAVFSNFALFKSRTEFSNQYASRKLPFIEGACLDLNFYNNIPEATVTLENCPYWVNNKPYANFTDVPGLSSSGGLNGTVPDNGELVNAVAPRIGRGTGLVIEGAATNLLRYSEDFTNAAWVKEAGVSYNSSTNQFVFTDTYKAVRQTVAAANQAVNYVASFRLSGSGDIQIYAQENGGDFTVYGGFVEVSLTDTPTTYEVPFAKDDTNATRVVFRNKSDTSVVIEPQFVQLETGSTASTHIPTADSPVTRTADSVTLTDLAALGLTSSVLASGYTIYVKATAQWSGVVPLFEVNDATVNERVRLYFEAGALRLTVHRSGVQRTARAANVALSAGDVLTGAIRVAPDNVNVAANGQSATADTSALMPSPTRLQLFTDLANRFLNGAGVRLAVFPRALSDAELQALTA